MLSFRLVSLQNALANDDVLAAWELAAFFMQGAGSSILPLDEDSAVDWYINTVVDEGARTAYNDEFQMAADEMVEFFTGCLREMAQKRVEHLGFHYPFTLNTDGYLEVKPYDQLTAVGASYLTLQFFRAVNGKTIEIEGANDAEITNVRARFDREFRKVFEFIAGYTVAGRKLGASYMTSHSRSSQKLNQLLNRICRKLGSGAVTPYGSWNIAQTVANDGGVDCIVHIGGPQMLGDAHLMLVGATVQKSAIDTKIIGPQKISFFANFFSTKPAAFQGALVRPQDEDDLTKHKCTEMDCLLYSYEQIWMNMGKRTAGDYQRSCLAVLDAKTRKLLREFKGVVFLHEYDSYPLVA